MRAHFTALVDALGLPDASAFDPASRPHERAGANSKRIVASALVSCTGFLLLVPNLVPLASGDGPLVGLILSALGTGISLGLIVVGYLLYRSSFSSANAVRIAGWNLLGVVVLGAVMVGLLGYQDLVGGSVETPAFVVANMLSIGAGAHVIIGVYDARRVRAEQLARERQRIAILTRVLRHNLRNEATVLLGHADHLASEIETPGLARSAAIIKDRAETIGGLTDKTKRIMRARDRRHAPTEPIDVTEIVTRVAEDVRGEHPTATVTTDVSADLWIRGDEGVEEALHELAENAVGHTERADPEVLISATTDANGKTAITVADNGPGIPESERAVVTDEAEITSLTHGTGLGLWVVRAAVDACDGDLAFESTPTGTRATLRFESCEPAAVAV